jgi:hypothetical protein
VTDLPIVNPKRQRRPALRLDAVNTLVSKSTGDEQALYVVLAATGMRISEALALETKHFVNGGRTIEVAQQVDRDTPRVVQYLKTDAGTREVDLPTGIAEYLRVFINGKSGLLFWMGHQPETMSELYSRMEFELERRLDEAERVGVGFTVPTVEVAPSAPRISEEVELELALQVQ